MLISPSKKCYIGKTICLKNRFRQHRTPNKNTDGRAIYRALKKYGWDNFLKVIIEVFDDDVSNEYIFEREIYWIKYHGSLGPKGYNCTKGGEGLSGRIISSETRAKLSAASKGKNNPNFGNSHSDATKAKMSRGIRDYYENRSEEQIAQHKEKSYQNAKKYMKPVIATEKKTGIKRKFESTNDAARTLATETGKKFNRSHVSNCANKRPNYNSHHGWTFEFVT